MRGKIVVGCGMVALGATLLRLRRGYVMVNVLGVSMEPTLRHGDRVLVRRRRLADLRRGDIAVFEVPVGSGVPGEPPTPTFLVKRVVALPGDPMPDGVPPAEGAEPTRRVPSGTLVAFGDGSMSWDSRQLGPYRADGVLGRYVCRTRKAPI